MMTEQTTKDLIAALNALAEVMVENTARLLVV